MNRILRLSLVTLALIVALCTPLVNAQVFEIKKGSKNYDASIDVHCENDECDGQAKIILYKKATNTLVQVFKSDDLTMYLDKKQKPSVNVIQLYDEQSALIFDDFNFDGTEDIAIRNGNKGSYGGPTYDVYVFNQTRKKFMLSEELSTLTRENLGMFQNDPQRKRIITFNKSGCCYHITSEYAVVPQKGLVPIYELIEDARSISGDKVKVTERYLLKGKWREKTKYYPIDQYYKN